jgi:integrase
MTHWHLPVKRLEDVTGARIEDFIIRRIREDGIAPKTANRIREVLHKLFNYATRKWNFVPPDRRHPNPAALVERRPEAPRVIRFLTAEQIERQLEVLEGHPAIRVLVATFIYAGLRREEALWLTHQDVDRGRRLIHVRAKTIAGASWQPKTRRNRVVPISTALAEVLAEYGPRPGNVWFFPSPQGRRWHPDNFSQALRKVNVEHRLPWSCLDYRHTFGSHLAQKGVSLYKVAELMGNTPEICRRHYGALVPEKMHDVVEFGDPDPPDAQDHLPGARGDRNGFDEACGARGATRRCPCTICSTGAERRTEATRFPVSWPVDIPISVITYFFSEGYASFTAVLG